jgi:hypothetical protein
MPDHKQNEKPPIERFRETARALGVDEDIEQFPDKLRGSPGRSRRASLLLQHPDRGGYNVLDLDRGAKEGSQAYCVSRQRLITNEYHFQTRTPLSRHERQRDTVRLTGSVIEACDQQFDMLRP